MLRRSLIGLAGGAALFGQKFRPNPFSGRLDLITPLSESMGARLRRAASSAVDPWQRPHMLAVAPWQPSTAYRGGKVVAHGGNLYACVTDGTSASSGGPTNTAANSNADGTTLWLYYGRNVVTSDPTMAIGSWSATAAVGLGQILRTSAGLMYAVVAAGTTGSTAPTALTHNVTDGSATLSYYGVYAPNAYAGDWPTISFATTEPSGASLKYTYASGQYQRAMALRGGYYRDTTPGATTSFVDTFVGGVTPSSQRVMLEFWTDATMIVLRSPQSTIYRPLIVIDGVRYDLSSDAPTISGSGSYWAIDWRTAGGRRVRRYEISVIVGYEIGVDQHSQIWSAATSDDIRAVFISDSLLAGSGYGPVVAGNGAWQRIAWSLGWRDRWGFVQGGTGYLARGTNPGVSTDTYGARLAQAIALKPDVFVFMGSTNDGGYADGTFKAAALDCLRRIRASGSQAVIIVFGVWSVNSAGVAQKETQLQEAVTELRDPLGRTFFLPIYGDTNLPWLTGAWNNAANTTSTNTTAYNADGTHPPDIGTAYLAHRMTQAIREHVLPFVK